MADIQLNTIYNEDCVETMRRMPDNFIDLIVTDPPYGVDWQSNRRIIKHDKIANDSNLSWVEPTFFEMFRVLKAGGVCITFYGWPYVDVFMRAWKSAGFKPKSHLIWVKNNMGLGWFTRGQHEPMFLLVKGVAEKPRHAISDVIHAATTGNKLHPTEKPLSLMRKLVDTYSKPNSLIFDPFMGSGTTARACKDLGRNYIGSEISKEYCDIAEQRLRQETLF